MPTKCHVLSTFVRHKLAFRQDNLSIFSRTTKRDLVSRLEMNGVISAHLGLAYL